eukprot:scaffold141636_cov154-Phaeocystis_antarctica.AAC.1
MAWRCSVRPERHSGARRLPSARRTCGTRAPEAQVSRVSAHGVDPEGLAKRKSPKGKSGSPDMFSHSRLAIDRRPRWT